MVDVETNDYVIEQAERQGESLLVGELVLYIERYHDDDAPGISRETLEAYVEQLAQKGFFPRGPNDILERIEQNTVDSETWVEEDAYYPVGEDRISSYPIQWHDELSNDDDLRAFVRVMWDGIESGQDTDTGGKGVGVPEQLLLDTATVLGDYGRDEAKEELEEWRDRDELVMDADQHRAGRVRLPEHSSGRE